LFQFIVDVPVDWEATRMLNGEIGEYVTLARKQRGGEDWFIGSITNEKKRDLDLALNFLTKNKTYVAEIYRDAADANWKTNPIAYKIEKQLVTRDSILLLHLAPGGGEAIRMKPATREEQEKLRN
jgi:alpha-glucosidase